MCLPLCPPGYHYSNYQIMQTKKLDFWLWEQEKVDTKWAPKYNNCKQISKNKRQTHSYWPTFIACASFIFSPSLPLLSRGFDWLSLRKHLVDWLFIPLFGYPGCCLFHCVPLSASPLTRWLTSHQGACPSKHRGGNNSPAPRPIVLLWVPEKGWKIDNSMGSLGWEAL